MENISQDFTTKMSKAPVFGVLNIGLNNACYKLWVSLVVDHDDWFGRGLINCLASTNNNNNNDNQHLYGALQRTQRLTKI